MEHPPHDSHRRLAEQAPKLAQLTEQVLFGDIWQRPGLSPRERSLATLSALAVLARAEQLPFHLQLAQRNGLDRATLTELFTHLAFYGGWPIAVSALEALAHQHEEH
ncbi:MAG: hypothetical protein GAK43_01102 [Stenotrophomonas maltophilia]|nr:MAG: hypothetical protein GAK43_01102 [Stenotrophomonas maltophilia]